MNQARRVVFVCTGNVCRSAMAEQLLRHLARKNGLALEAASAGTAAYAHYQVPTVARRLLASEGVPPFEHTPRLATGELLRSADLILAMAAEHRDYVLQLYPDLAPRTRLLREAAGYGPQDLEDPISQPDEAFVRCLASIRDSLEAMIRSRFHDPRGSPAAEDFARAPGCPRTAPLRDSLLSAVLPEKRMTSAVIARLEGSEAVLDVGCGTGRLALAIKRELPGCRVVGLDGHPRMLRTARRRAGKLGVTLELRSANATELPFGDSAFDAAVARMVLGGLRPAARKAALREAVRVLRPGGRLLVMDRGAGRFVPLLMECGLTKVREVWTRGTVLGPVQMLEAGR